MIIKSSFCKVLLLGGLMVLFSAELGFALTDQEGRRIKFPDEVERSSRTINQDYDNHITKEKQKIDLAVPEQYAGTKHRKKKPTEVNRTTVRPYMSFAFRGSMLSDMELDSDHAVIHGGINDGAVDNNPNISNTVSSDFGGGFSVAGGLYMENGMRTELEIAQTFNKLNKIEDTGSELKSVSLERLHPNIEMTTYMLNVIYDSTIKRTVKWGPYFGIGAGLGDFTMNIKDMSSGGEYADTTWVAQAMVGLSYSISPKGSSLYLGYRYLGSGDIEYTITGVNKTNPAITKDYDIKHSYSNNILEFGFRGNF